MKNKVVVITGASQGLGRELAIQIAALGAKVALVARTEKLLISLKNEITTAGGVAAYFVCDVTQQDQVTSTVAKILTTFSTIDTLINNAGIWTNDHLEAKNPKLIESTILINSLGPILFSKAVASIFEKNQSGHFVFINSIAGLEMPEANDCSVYAASKWALTGFAQALKYKYNKTPIKTTSVHPGPFSSNLEKNSGDDWGSDHSSLMSVTEVAAVVISAINAPGKIQIGSIEFKKTNWNQ